MTWRNKSGLCLPGLVLLGTSFSLEADTIVRELGREDGEPVPHTVPYAFASGSMGFVGGATGGIGGGVFIPFKPGRSYLQFSLFHLDRDHDQAGSPLPLRPGMVGRRCRGLGDVRPPFSS